MTTTSGWPLTVAPPTVALDIEVFPHISGDESQAKIQAGMLQLSVKISRRVALLEASSGDPARSSDDLAALAWIQQSLEGIEVTIIGLSE